MAGQVSERAIEIARGYVGKVESKLKPNWAEWLEMLMKASGNPAKWVSGEPYCIAALCAIFAVAASQFKVRFPVKWSKSTQQFYEYAKLAGMTGVNPSIGDIVIYRVGNLDRGHAGIVVSVTPEGIGTIEFNTSGAVAGSQRNGDGCYMRYRRFADFQKTDKPRLWIRGYVTTSQL